MLDRGRIDASQQSARARYFLLDSASSRLHSSPYACIVARTPNLATGHASQHNTTQQQQRQLMFLRLGGRPLPRLQAQQQPVTDGSNPQTKTTTYVPPTTLNENIRTIRYKSEHPTGPYISVQGGILRPNRRGREGLHRPWPRFDKMVEIYLIVNPNPAPNPDCLGKISEYSTVACNEGLQYGSVDYQLLCRSWVKP